MAKSRSLKKDWPLPKRKKKTDPRGERAPHRDYYVPQEDAPLEEVIPTVLVRYGPEGRSPGPKGRKSGRVHPRLKKALIASHNFSDLLMDTETALALVSDGIEFAEEVLRPGEDHPLEGLDRIFLDGLYDAQHHYTQLVKLYRRLVRLPQPSWY
jgi:hypothetical protein